MTVDGREVKGKKEEARSGGGGEGSAVGTRMQLGVVEATWWDTSSEGFRPTRHPMYRIYFSTTAFFIICSPVAGVKEHD